MMSGQSSQPTGFYRRLEQKLLDRLPALFSPLRLRIFFGYLLFLLLAIYGWEQISAAWRYLSTLMIPVVSLMGAIVALKLSVVFASLLTLLTALLKIFFGFLVAVLKPGILKAIFIPQLLSVAGWVHKKSERLQASVRRVYEWLKDKAETLVNWWQAQKLIDKLLLSGFLVPLLLVVFVIFVIKRAVAIFAVKKATEQLVQKTTKFVIKNFNKVPLVGMIPAAVAQGARKVTRKEDRVHVVDDLKVLGSEIYSPVEDFSNDAMVDSKSDGDFDSDFDTKEPGNPG